MAVFERRWRGWFVVAGVVLTLAAAAGAGCGGKGDGSAETAKGEATYFCPMHPTYVSDRPGDCPICNMKLVPIDDPNAAAEHAAGEAQSKTGERKILFYRNPMDPSVTSPVPMKDEMGMDYVPVYSDEISGGAGTGVEGYAPIRLTDEKIRLAGVQTARALSDRVARTVRTVGLVTPDERRVRRVQTKVSGWVEQLHVNFMGQAVSKGQPIVAIYSPELLASQEEFLRAREAAARAEGTGTADAARDLVEASRRRLRLFDVPESFIEEMERTGEPRRTVTLLAPVSGYVTSKEIFEGTQVAPGMELFTVTDLSRVWIEAQVYEYEAPFVKLEQEASLSLAYDPSVRLTGRVTYIAPFLDPETRTLTVRFEFDNPVGVLKPGMYADVELGIDAGEGIVVPESAVLDTGTRQIVFVDMGGGLFEPREVRAGAHAGGRVQILSGVAEGERVVVRANFLLDSESRMRAGISKASEPKPGTAGEPAAPAPPAHQHRGAQ